MEFDNGMLITHDCTNASVGVGLDSTLSNQTSVNWREAKFSIHSVLLFLDVPRLEIKGKTVMNPLDQSIWCPVFRTRSANAEAMESL